MVAMLLWSAGCFFKRHSRVLSDKRESCARSCSALSHPLQGGANVGQKSSSSCWEVRHVCSTSGIVGGSWWLGRCVLALFADQPRLVELLFAGTAGLWEAAEAAPT